MVLIYYLRTMGSHVFTYEEFVTLITRIEAVLNSRPLTPVTTDPSDLDYLSPGHFLIGQPLLAIPPRVEFDSTVSIKVVGRCLTSVTNRFGGNGQPNT